MLIICHGRYILTLRSSLMRGCLGTKDLTVCAEEQPRCWLFSPTPQSFRKVHCIGRTICFSSTCREDLACCSASLGESKCSRPHLHG